MKLTLAILVFIALAAQAQTNEPVVQVKFYSDLNRTNKVHIFSTPMAARWITCSVIGVFKSGRMQLMIQGADDPENGKLIILDGYPAVSTMAIDDVIKIYAHQTGTIMGVNQDGSDMNGLVRPFWEYVDFDAENLKIQREIDLHMNQMQIEQLAMQRANEAAARQKNFLIQSNVINWLKPQATNGDASAQCNLGEHYLNGQGCETNKTLAIYWLQKAAEQGDSEASNRLAKINLASTNAVVESKSN